MGIQGLAKLIADEAPSSVKQCDLKSFFGELLHFFVNIFLKSILIVSISEILGRKIAIDATMSLYQFLIAVRSEGVQLTSVDGETTR